MPEKSAEYPNFYDICPKINKIPEFYMIFARKVPEFYIGLIIARKILLPDFFFFGGGAVLPCPLSPVSYAYAVQYTNLEIVQ